MAKQRYVNTFFWDDAYIESLSPNEKLVFIYLITTPLTNIAGSFEITLKKICDHTALSKAKVGEILSKFERDGKFLYRDNWMLALNAIEHQDFNNPKIAKGIEIIISDSPRWAIDRVCIAYIWLSDRLSHLNSNLNSNPNPKGEEPDAPEPPPLNKPALALYEEMFGTVGAKFGEQIQLRVKDLGIWHKLLSDKSSFADDPQKKAGVSKWILKAYDECVMEKKNERKQQDRLPTLAEKIEERKQGLKNLQPPPADFVSGMRRPRQDNSGLSKGSGQA